MKAGRKPQDRDREDALRKLFKLSPANQNRTGPDAVDEAGRLFELKSTTRDRVSTARGVGLDHLAKWRKLNWIIGRGHYSSTSFTFEQTFFLTPVQMEPWFSAIEAKVTQNDVLFARALSLLDINGFTAAECDRIRSALRRGVLLNDPKITWTYVCSHGVRIDNDHAKRLRKLLG